MDEPSTSTASTSTPLIDCNGLEGNREVFHSCSSILAFQEQISTTIQIINEKLARDWSEGAELTEAIIDQKRELTNQIEQLLDNFKTECFNRAQLLIKDLRNLNTYRENHERRVKSHEILKNLDMNVEENKVELAKSLRARDETRQSYQEKASEYSRKISELQMFFERFEFGMIMEETSSFSLDLETPESTSLQKLLDEYKDICFSGQSRPKKRTNIDDFDSWKKSLPSPRSLNLPIPILSPDEIPQEFADSSLDYNDESTTLSEGSQEGELDESIPTYQRKHSENERLIRKVDQNYHTLLRTNAYILNSRVYYDDYNKLQRLNDEVRNLLAAQRNERPAPEPRNEPRERGDGRRNINVERTTIKSINELDLKIKNDKRELGILISQIKEDVEKIENLKRSLMTLKDRINKNDNSQELLNAEESIYDDLTALNQNTENLTSHMRRLRHTIINNERIIHDKIRELTFKLSRRKRKLEGRNVG